MTGGEPGSAAAHAPARTAPFLSPKGALLALALAVVACWPMLLTKGPMLFNDTFLYLAEGRKMVAIATALPGRVAAELADLLGLAVGGQGGGSGGGGAQVNEGANLRGLSYPFFLFATGQTPLGLIAPVILQTAATIWVLLAFLPARIPPVGGLAIAAIALTIGLSPLPWYAIFAMPDLLGALVVLVYAVALRRIDDLSIWQTGALVVLGAFATAAHYGHLPLAAGLALGILAWRLVARRLTLVAVIVCLAPVALAAGVNFAASKATFDSGSVAPKRLPILLARSLQDGPAAWYLQDACPEAGYTICEVFPEIPTRVGDFLWGPDSIEGATRAQIEAIRAEETEILIAAFRRYPLDQTRALFGNALLQTVTIGIDKLIPSSLRIGDRYAFVEDFERRAAELPTIRLFDTLLPLTTAAAALALAVAMVRRRLPPDVFGATLVVVAGLGLNAAIFGGLSYPVDRYQSRIVWLLPALLALALICPDPRAGMAGGPGSSPGRGRRRRSAEIPEPPSRGAARDG